MRTETNKYNPQDFIIEESLTAQEESGNPIRDQDYKQNKVRHRSIILSYRTSSRSPHIPRKAIDSEAVLPE